MNRFLGGVLTITSFIAAARAADTAASRPAPEGLAKGLVAHYSFDGDVRDASGRGNHGQIKGRVRFVPGVIGKAARFGGRAEPGYVLVPNSKSLQFQRGFSIACWVRILDVGRRARVGERRHEDHHVFVAKSADPAGFYFHAHYGYWSKPPVGLGADNNKPTKTSVLAVTDKLEREWMHVAAVSDAHGLRLYFDGKRVKTAEKPVDFAAANSQLMYIGRQGNASPFPLNGMIDELRIYNRALSDEEIETLYRSDRPTER